MRNADVHRRERHERMLDPVPRQDDDGAVRRQVPIEQRLCDPPRGLERGRIREPSPSTIIAANREKRAVGRLLGPVRELIGQGVGI